MPFQYSTSSSRISWILVSLPLAYLWFRLIDDLRIEWITNPQYGYGCVVPLLCFGLILRKWPRLKNAPFVPGSKPRVVLIVFIFLGILYLPTRLVEAATPEWRPIQWLLGIETIGLTLCIIYLGKGKNWLRCLMFPVLFFFVAIPWPSLFEQPIIQTLTGLSANIVTELLGWIDVPTMVHGNVIAVSNGVVGIDEACSGIRSFQSSLMISLFFGDFYDLNRSARCLLVPTGFVLSMVFNVCRMAFLTFIAAKKGVTAISKYHDPAGITIAITCTLALWGLASWFKWHNQKKVTEKPQMPMINEASSQVPKLPRVNLNATGLKTLTLALIMWLILVEAGVQLWYHQLESRIKPGPDWSLNFPSNNPSMKDLPISVDTRNLLRYDEGREVEWTEPDGTQWQVFYCSWMPGRVAGYLAKRHTPEICLQATGLKMISGPDLTVMKINGVDLPIRSYEFVMDGGIIQVFHCRWEAGVTSSAYVKYDSDRFNLVRGIWAGRGNKGQKVLEVIISGINDPLAARESLVKELEKLVLVKVKSSGLK
jgi:exosortase